MTSCRPFRNLRLNELNEAHRPLDGPIWKVSFLLRIWTLFHFKITSHIVRYWLVFKRLVFLNRKRHKMTTWCFCKCIFCNSSKVLVDNYKLIYLNLLGDVSICPKVSMIIDRTVNCRKRSTNKEICLTLVQYHKAFYRMIYKILNLISIL